jgi:hypothetical protein
LLTKYHIPTDIWSTGDAKIIDHLVNEINDGETILIEDKESEKLIRQFSFLAVTVLYKDNEATYKLIEEKQVFTDGRTRVRSSDISVGEKIKHNENNIEDSIKRALQEELEIHEGFTVNKSDNVKEDVDSKSYPGLTSQRNRFNVVAHIDSTQYKPEGYQEVQSDKTTYFVWEKFLG